MNDLYIEIDKDKEPYYKKISDDKVINLTGESGSGKSYYSTKYINDDNYIVIDTDEVYGRFDKSKGANRKFGEYLRSKYDVLPDNCGQFDLLLSEILEYFKDTDKILVIDSAQYRNLKDYSLLKGELIVMRTCIDTCYQRCIDRWKERNKDYKQEELNKFMERKKGMYSWYRAINTFLENVDKI